MGYDDDHYPPNPDHRKKRRRLFPGIMGVIIGALLVIVALKLDILPNEWTRGQDGDANSIPIAQNDSPNTSKYVNVDVSTQVTDVIDEVSPAVVGIINIQRQVDFWQQHESEAGTGSGVIYKRDGGNAYIVTNHHVIKDADTIEVVLSDDIHLEAELLGSDLFSDLAVLRMDDKEVKSVIDLGSSDTVKVGEPAIAIGNPLGMRFSGSVTQGVISGKQRTIPQDFNNDGRPDWQAEVIQTDAAINPGNSGGALINIKGQLIGINSMKISQAVAQGIGFAIPIDAAQPIIAELEGKGKVTRPFLGVEIYSLEEVPQTEWDDTLNLPKEIQGGVYVWSVEPLSPADSAGVKRLDVITKLDGKEIMDVIDLRKVLFQEKKVGDTIKVTFYRDGNEQETSIKLGVQR